MTEEKKHYRFGASSSERWIHCPPSIKASEGKPKTKSAAAEEGTFAHDVLETSILLGISPLNIHTLYGKPVPVEMRNGVAMVIQYILDWLSHHPKGMVYPELVVDYGQLIHEEEGKGTSDVNLISPTELCVVDLKYGRKIVKAKNNSQLKLYAVGALAEFFKVKRTHAGMLKPFKIPLDCPKQVRLVIIQPRVSKPIDEWTIDVVDLLEWLRTTVKEAIIESQDANGKRTPGEYCHFCPASIDCRALVSNVFNRAAMDFAEDGEQEPIDVADLDPEEVFYALEYAEVIEAWLENVKEAGMRLILSGHESEQFKLVYKQTKRFIKDDRGVRQLLNKTNADIDTYAPRKLVGIGELTKVFKKSKIDIAKLDKYIGKPEAEVTIASADDNRVVVEPKDYRKYLKGK